MDSSKAVHRPGGTGFQGKTMNRSNALEYVSLEGAIKVISEGTAMFSPEALAGQYAYESAKQADSAELGEEYLTAHLEYLQDNGAVFDMEEALKVAQDFAQEFSALQ